MFSKNAALKAAGERKGIANESENSKAFPVKATHGASARSGSSGSRSSSNSTTSGIDINEPRTKRRCVGKNRKKARKKTPAFGENRGCHGNRGPKFCRERGSKF